MLFHHSPIDPSKAVERDLENVMDLMNQETVSYQKTRAYSQQVKNEEAKRLLDRICQHHKQNFTCLDEFILSQK